MFPHWLLHQGSPQSYMTYPHYFLRTSAEITVGLWCILPSAGNTQAESSPFSSFSIFRTANGHISHLHSEPGINVSASAESCSSPVFCPRFICWELPIIPQTRLEVKGTGEYSPITRISGFAKKWEDCSDGTVVSENRDLQVYQKPLWFHSSHRELGFGTHCYEGLRGFLVPEW